MYCKYEFIGNLGQQPFKETYIKLNISQESKAVIENIGLEVDEQSKEKIIIKKPLDDDKN